MNILFTICARAGSKGVKSKNIRSFVGKPLVYYTYEAYKRYADEFKNNYQNIRLAVNTDSKELIEQLNELGAEYIYIERKEDLAGDFVSKMDVIRDTVKKVEEQDGIQYDVTVDLDLTSPLRTVADIKGTMETLLNDGKADIAFSVTDSRRSPYFNMVYQSEAGYYEKVIRTEYVSRQQTPKCYDMNASIYAYRREYMMSGREQDRKALVWTMRDTAVLDIDSEDDLELMEVLAAYFFKKYSDYIC